MVFFVDVVEKRYLVQIFFHLTDDVGNKRWLHLLALKTTPLEVLEKRVFLYLPSPRKTQPLFLGLYQEAIDEVWKVGRPPLRQIFFSEADIPPQHFLSNFSSVFAFVRAFSNGEFIENDSKRIEVGRVGVILFEQYLRSHIDRSSTGLIPKLSSVIGFLLGNAKISEPGVPIFFENDVLGLEVFVDDVHGVNILECHQYAGNDKL